MSCPDCDALREEVNYLRGLVAGVDADMPKLRDAYGVTPAQARVLVTLYNGGKGGLITKDRMFHALWGGPDYEPEHVEQTARTTICRARVALGRRWIRPVWGKGWFMEPEGVEALRAVLA